MTLGRVEGPPAEADGGAGRRDGFVVPSLSPSSPSPNTVLTNSEPRTSPLEAAPHFVRAPTCPSDSTTTEFCRAEEGSYVPSQLPAQSQPTTLDIQPDSEQTRLLQRQSLTSSESSVSDLSRNERDIADHTQEADEDPSTESSTHLLNEVDLDEALEEEFDKEGIFKHFHINNNNNNPSLPPFPPHRSSSVDLESLLGDYQSLPNSRADLGGDDEDLDACPRLDPRRSRGVIPPMVSISEQALSTATTNGATSSVDLKPFMRASYVVADDTDVDAYTTIDEVEDDQDRVSSAVEELPYDDDDVDDITTTTTTTMVTSMSSSWTSALVRTRSYVVSAAENTRDQSLGWDEEDIHEDFQPEKPITFVNASSTILPMTTPSLLDPAPLPRRAKTLVQPEVEAVQWHQLKRRNSYDLLTPSPALLQAQVEKERAFHEASEATTSSTVPTTLHEIASTSPDAASRGGTPGVVRKLVYQSRPDFTRDRFLSASEASLEEAASLAGFPGAPTGGNAVAATTDQRPVEAEGKPYLLRPGGFGLSTTTTTTLSRMSRGSSLEQMQSPDNPTTKDSAQDLTWDETADFGQLEDEEAPLTIHRSIERKPGDGIAACVKGHLTRRLWNLPSVKELRLSFLRLTELRRRMQQNQQLQQRTKTDEAARQKADEQLAAIREDVHQIFFLQSTAKRMAMIRFHRGGLAEDSHAQVRADFDATTMPSTTTTTAATTMSTRATDVNKPSQDSVKLNHQRQTRKASIGKVGKSPYANRRAVRGWTGQGNATSASRGASSAPGTNGAAFQGEKSAAIKVNKPIVQSKSFSSSPKAKPWK